MTPAAYELSELAPSMRADAASVLARAFLDDPAWVAIGPRRERPRLRLLQRYYRILVDESMRWGGPSYCALEAGSVVGVALTYADGLRFPPPRATLREAPPFILAGPGPGLRAAYVDNVMKRAHPREPHQLLWYLGTHPDMQRRGVGRALMLRVLEDAAREELPTYLDTTKAENLPYYRSFGFREIGEARLVRGARVWFMSHEPLPDGR